MKLGKNVTIYPLAKLACQDGISIGDETTIDDFAFLYGRGQGIEIGRFCHITAHVCIIAGGLVKMGDFSAIGYGGIVIGCSDSYNGEGLIGLKILDKYRREYPGGVIMGKHVHIGAGATILPGVTIGEGCSVGAGSLVTKSLPEWTICYGSPCKVMKDKPREKQLEFERKFLEEYEVKNDKNF